MQSRLRWLLLELRWLGGKVVAGLVMVGMVLVMPLAIRAAASPSSPSPEDSARRFFHRYVDDDGRVVRRDQGGDTVSEGQAYAMLLAVALGDRERFASVWGWARDNLQRDDGLLSWHWVGGQVADAQSAADADLDAAWALMLAADRFDEPSYRDEAARIATAILDQETVPTPLGPVLVAGPWARTDPARVNPSYFSFAAYDALGTLTGDARWAQVSDSSRRIVDTLTAGGRLPPDWASVGTDGTVTAVPAEGSDAPPEYGLDAARVVVRAATGCKSDRAAAKRVARVLDQRGHLESGQKVSIDGQSEVADTRSAVMLVAGAAAADAAGWTTTRDRALGRASSFDRQHPSYYGSAWIALGTALLDRRLGATCAPAAP
ncbi:MAG TPA: glycosyl hydrolase family 8 [Acidimicrobiia bacterium]|jgi:endoglucanase